MNNVAMIVPGALEALQALSQAAGQAGIPETTIDLVHFRASQINGCSVCADMHSRSARKHGATDQQLFTLAAWRDAPYFSEAERAALALTEAVTRLADSPDAGAGRRLERGRAALRRESAGVAADPDRRDQRLQPPERRHATTQRRLGGASSPSQLNEASQPERKPQRILAQEELGAIVPWRAEKVLGCTHFDDLSPAWTVSPPELLVSRVATLPNTSVNVTGTKLVPVFVTEPPAPPAPPLPPASVIWPRAAATNPSMVPPAATAPPSVPALPAWLVMAPKRETAAEEVDVAALARGAAAGAAGAGRDVEVVRLKTAGQGQIGLGGQVDRGNDVELGDVAARAARARRRRAAVAGGDRGRVGVGNLGSEDDDAGAATLRRHPRAGWRCPR